MSDMSKMKSSSTANELLPFDRTDLYIRRSDKEVGNESTNEYTSST